MKVFYGSSPSPTQSAMTAAVAELRREETSLRREIKAAATVFTNPRQWTSPTLASGIVRAGGTNEATFELHLRTILSPRGRPGKEIGVKHRSTSPDRVLRKVLMASALTVRLTAVSTIRSASAHVDHA
jgi:hypothetical protein